MKIIVSKLALEMAVKNICRVIRSTSGRSLPTGRENTKNALPIMGDVLCILDV